MRGLRNLLSLCFLLPMVALAQEGPEPSIAPAIPQNQQPLFVVELTEIEDWSPRGLERASKLDANQLIRESTKNGSDRKRNILRVSAVEGIESYAQFAKRIPVVVVTTTRQDGTKYDYTDENVGTEVRVIVTRFDEARVRVELSFASSDVNLRPDGTKEGVDVITATSSHRVELGMPVVVDAKVQGKSSVLVLSVELAERNKPAVRSTQSHGN